ncbi:CoB--CoM heterodisulfide reductase iron-sulfur subunit A family protein [Geobacter sp. DSM 9736]|uniref:CoB--CoM heterodisulfide reductase iron-sulfur subunit A family protein n=1 Tax=Geobacter sp. DSM 9736 TaxID=1277350 RepID=UPI000B511E46|nr:CoB--CoM heterodisulfide reductase iron-sulfur subunit A family protein [Geobacter sp. DSM 9736]SNB44947.1 heterodisulfide reductase subunit A [Geobacter sp. DSM 9736]
MKIAVYFCNCGSNIAEKIDPAEVGKAVSALPDVAWFKTADFICSEDGKAFLEADIAENRPDRIVVAACSPRDHEGTFMRVMTKAGMNPYLLQMVNIREQVAWVTEEAEKAVAKAVAAISGAVARVRHHVPLEKKELEASRDVLIVGAGPAGLKAALTLAEAGRKVVLVEKEPVIGGLPVRYEELFPDMECGPCMLEPVLGEILHGEHAENIELLTMAELVDVAGFYGNFIATIHQRPRYVDQHQCIGCGECIAVCPGEASNAFNCGLNQRRAIDFPFMGALPNAPFLDMEACVRSRGEECRACKDSCPMGEDVINYDDQERVIERNVGGIILATGASLLDCSSIPSLGYGTLPDVYTSLEFERLLSSTGPTGGEILRRDGSVPGSVAIIHCVGSLDPDHREYCSGICCQYAFKFNHLIGGKLPDARVHHFYREVALPDKSAFTLYHHARKSPNATFHRFESGDELAVTAGNKGGAVVISGESRVEADMVVLCPAVVPGPATAELGRLLDVTLDRFGFFEELHGRIDAARSKIKGVYLAGSCQAPMDIQKAALQGMAATGHVLSDLAEGRKLEIEPINAEIDEERCAGCKVCLTVCPYKAVSFDAEKEVSTVNAVLCHGCGTCVAACPAGAITGNHFTNKQIIEEIQGVLG